MQITELKVQDTYLKGRISYLSDGGFGVGNPSSVPQAPARAGCWCLTLTEIGSGFPSTTLPQLQRKLRFA